MLDKQALENCMGVVVMSLAVVMAGTGHLPTFKLLRGGSALLHMYARSDCHLCTHMHVCMPVCWFPDTSPPACIWQS